MPPTLLLASGSDIRRQLLRNAGLEFEVGPVRVDEESIRQSLEAASVSPDQIADALADAKARKAGNRHPDKLALGCDQILAFESKIFAKPRDVDEAVEQLMQLQGKTHDLYSAAVLFEGAKPVWRHTGRVRLTMRAFGREALERYAVRNWDSIQHSVGGYKIEEEGIRLFRHIEGDYFHILGLPLMELLGYLSDTGHVAL